MGAVISEGRVRGTLVLLAVAALFATATSTAAAAECEPTMPKAELAAGMTGSGLTVASGRTREAFAVEVLGILPDAIAPGRDMILVEATSPSIERAGGIWHGMSGSPVYVGGRLIGALGYGLGTATGASAIGGVTPIEDMQRVLAYPAPAARRAASPRGVVLPRRASRVVARRLGVSAAKTFALQQLRLPFSVSGVSARGLQRVERFVEARNLPLLPLAGSSAGAGSAPAAPGSVEPGDSFAGVLSYGDVTGAGVGTVTYVCNGRLLAFGHPLGLFGPTVMGASAADVLTLVRDPYNGPFKLATIGESLGRVDQDRLAGLRGVLGAPPRTIPIRSSVSMPATGVRNDGQTDLVAEPFAGLVSFLHVGSSVESTFDGMRPGTSRVAWTIEGTRASGAPWRLTRENLYAAGGELGFESAWELATNVDTLLLNDFEDVELTGVHANVSLREGLDAYTIDRVLVARGQARLRERRTVRAQPGDQIRVRVVLDAAERGRPDRNLDLAFRLPRGVRPAGLIEIGPPRSSFEFDEECMIEDSCEDGPAVKSFDELLRSLERAPRNDVLSARLRMGPKQRVKQAHTRMLDAVIRGRATIRIGGGGEG